MTSPDPDRLRYARIAGAVARHALGWRLTAEEEAVAVAELAEAAAGRTDLLAERAGTALGFGEGRPDAARYRQVAELCIAAGADPALIERWIKVGRERAATAAAIPYTGLPPGGLLLLARARVPVPALTSPCVPGSDPARHRFGGRSPGGEKPLSDRFTLVVLASGLEAQAPVEGLRAVLPRVVAHREPVMSASHGFPAQLLDRESPVAASLVLGTDVEPPQVTVEQRVVQARGESGHDEAHQLVAVVDQPGPGDIGHRVGVGKRPGDRGNQVILVRPQLQHAGRPDVLLGNRFQSQASPHAPHTTAQASALLKDAGERIGRRRGPLAWDASGPLPGASGERAVRVPPGTVRDPGGCGLCWR